MPVKMAESTKTRLGVLPAGVSGAIRSEHARRGRRQERRLALAVPGVTIRPRNPTAWSEQEARVLNLSAGGCLLQTNDPVPEGSSILINFAAPLRGARVARLPLQLEGTAVWCSIRNDGLRARHWTGVRWDGADDRNEAGAERAEILTAIEMERLRTVLTTTPTVIYACEHDGDFATTYVSENVLTLTGYSASELIADPRFWKARIHPEDVTAVFAALSNLPAIGHLNIEYRFLHRDGRYRWISDAANLVHDPFGIPIEIRGARTDISHRKEAEEELTEAYRHLERFLGIVAHDLRAPVGVLGTSLELLRGALPPNQKAGVGPLLPAMDHATERLVRLTQDLLDVSRIGAGRLVLTPKSINLAALLRVAVAQQQLVASDRRIDLKTPAHVTAHLDGDRIHQLVGNLISNALKYSPPESAVAVTLRATADQALILIEDRGQGIPAEQIGRLFEPFVRLDPHDGIQGTGLGLYIAQAIATAHGGRVWVESQVGHGSTFYVALPLHANEASPTA